VPKINPLVRSHLSPPLGEGTKGRGKKNYLKYQDFHPHPDLLPSRERGNFGLFTSQSRLIFQENCRKREEKHKLWKR
jgi:hypothetical protein